MAGRRGPNRRLLRELGETELANDLGRALS